MSYEPDSRLIDWQETRSRFGDCCASEGAAQVVSYERGRRILAVSEADPWLWRLLPAAVIGGALLSAWEVAGRPVLW